MTDVKTVWMDELQSAHLVCRHDGCPLPGRFAPKICIPARGYRLDGHKPMVAIFDLPLCDQHIGIATPADLLTDKGKGLFDEIAGRAGKVMPDYDRAWVARVSLNSPEFKQYMAAKRKGQQ